MHCNLLSTVTAKITRTGGINTKAALLLEAGGNVELCEVWLPEPSNDMVLIKMLASGICRSQLRHISKPSAQLPLLLGHEGVGTVVSVGESVSHLQVGDTAIISWVPRTPVVGRWQAPPVGAMLGTRSLNGYVFSWSEYCLVWGGYATKLPAGCPTEVAAVMGCAIATGAGAVLNIAGVKSGEHVVVLGCGGVGGATIATAIAQGAKTVIAADIRDEALEFASEMGATNTINIGQADLVTVAKTVCGGADWVFDTVGTSASLDIALRSSTSGGARFNNRGGTVVVIGMGAEQMEMNADELILHQRHIVGSLGDCQPEKDFSTLVELYKANKLPLDLLVKEKYRFEQVNEACYNLQSMNYSGRAILTFE